MALGDAASYDVNTGVTGDVDAAVAAAAGLRLMGWSARESDGTPAAASFNIVHGATGDGGDQIIPVELAANGIAHQWYGPQGIAVANGISTNHVAGTYDLTLFYLSEVPGG